MIAKYKNAHNFVFALHKLGKSSLMLLFIFVIIPAFGQHKDITKLKALLIEQINDSVKINLYVNIFNYYNELNSDSAYMYANEGLRYFKEKQNVKGQGAMYLSKGDYEDAHGNSKLAEDHYLQALKLFSSINYKKGIAGADNNLAAFEGKKGNYKKAITYILVAKKIYEEADNIKDLLSCLINLGAIYDELKDSSQTINYYYKADSIVKLMPPSENTAILYINIGEFYNKYKDTAKAFYYYNKSMALSDANDYPMEHLIASMDKSVLEYEIGNEKQGKAFLVYALNYARQHNLPQQEADILINFVSLDKNLNKDTGLIYLNNALNIAKYTENKPMELNVYRAFSSIYEKYKNFEESNKYLKLQHALSDSLLNINKAKEIANLSSVYELEKSNAKVQVLEIMVAKNNFQKIIIICICLSIIILFAIVLYYYRITISLNKTLKKNKSDLAELNNMKDKLLAIIGHDLRGPVGNIPPILSLIEEEILLPEEYVEVFSTLKEHSIIILETLDKLMLLGKSLLKQNNYEPQNFNPSSYIAKNIELMSITAKKKNITIKNYINENIYVFADAMHFDFILRNLLTNALKFSFLDGIIELAANENFKNGYVVFSVKDYGIGITKDRLNQMFKSTIRTTYGTENEKGNGIGLLLVNEFVIQNGGEIWVDSKEGEGSTFYFSLKNGKME